MYHIGIDIGSTYTKYCVMDGSGSIVEVLSEQTPIRQREYFGGKLLELNRRYPGAELVSCGYGRKNIGAAKNISELTALARGSYRQSPETGIVLDIGGQDTKAIRQDRGRIQEFFTNDRCAAGCGMFLFNTLSLLRMSFANLDLSTAKEPETKLSSVCAVFAQSEIVELLAADMPAESIVQSVLWQILTQAKALLGKTGGTVVVLSGGLAQIKGIGQFAERVLGVRVVIPPYAAYLSAIGCATLYR